MPKRRHYRKTPNNAVAMTSSDPVTPPPTGEPETVTVTIEVKGTATMNVPRGTESDAEAFMSEEFFQKTVCLPTLDGTIELDLSLD